MLPARRGGGQSSFTPVALHPLLAAAYPVVFLFAQNVAAQVTLRPFWIPLAASIQATAAQIQRKYGILNALRLPGVDPADAGFNDRSSPVNTFRYVMDAYFSADLPPLSDVSYLSPDYARLCDFVEVERTADGSPITPVGGGR